MLVFLVEKRKNLEFFVRLLSYVFWENFPRYFSKNESCIIEGEKPMNKGRNDYAEKTHDFYD